MKQILIDQFKLKRRKHKFFGTVYEYVFQKRDYVKDENALMYTLMEIERWARKQQEILKNSL